MAYTSSSQRSAQSSSSGQARGFSVEKLADEDRALLLEIMAALQAGGTPEYRAQKEARRQLLGEVQQLAQQYSTEAAFRDAAALMQQQTQRTMEKAAPAIAKAIQGAGASASSMQALLANKVAQEAALAAGALGAEQAKAYAPVVAQLQSLVEHYSRPDATALQALINSFGHLRTRTAEESRTEQSQSSSQEASSGSGTDPTPSSSSIRSSTPSSGGSNTPFSGGSSIPSSGGRQSQGQGWSRGSGLPSSTTPNSGGSPLGSYISITPSPGSSSSQGLPDWFPYNAPTTFDADWEVFLEGLSSTPSTGYTAPFTNPDWFNDALSTYVSPTGIGLSPGSSGIGLESGIDDWTRWDDVDYTPGTGLDTSSTGAWFNIEPTPYWDYVSPFSNPWWDDEEDW